MQYDFEKIPNRRGTDCIKWEHHAEDVLPMWVADMDFISPAPVVKALLTKIYQMLPSGGRLLLTEPMAQPPGEKPVGDAYFHFYLLAMGSGRLRSPDELRSLMLEAGFESVEPVANPMPLHTRMLLGQKR